MQISSMQGPSGPKQLLEEDSIDPFDALPVGGDSRYNGYVLNQFKIGALNFRLVETGRGQHPLTKRWMPHTVADPLLFLATLNFAAAHLDNIQGRPSSPRTIAQKIETIRLIYSRLQGSVDSVSATTIGAVALLPAMEII
ncbi:hypothetical protein HO173_010205 [Letharia columbiana]|uniref:Uncharacterized protein n=1 Tax=Letharia columbiana TaxID=112416 RepID=A0A8H6FNG5_9LECA|nr:uncharacterized protein HO173_010205 [Letharia columbiana]KAF6231673.1 hypothetical protein HO173_010205 [Letharia columbiana]